MGNQSGKLEAQNQSGRPKKNVHWKSAEHPSPPGRPILIPASDQQPDVVNLRWERPQVDGGSPITGYTVEHRRMGSPHWVRATPTPVLNCEAWISGLEPGWRYQFRVFAENIVGRSDASELSDSLTVTLQRNAITVPRFSDELEDLNAVEDERIEFRVRVLGQPPPEINWFKDGYEIFSSRRTKIVNDNDASVLIIHQVALTDEGEIKCTATNRAGHVVTRAKLFVQAPPRIRLPRTYEDGLIVEADEILRLKVGVAGQPPPNVTWLHEGELIADGGRYEIVNSEKNSLLKIDNIQRNDRGEYSIRATNKLGEDVSSFLVTVTARPSPPGKVRINMSFGKSATLSWTSPLDDGGCKIGNYIVEYFRIGWNVWLKAATTRSLSTTLNDLIEGSEYKFRVKAENPYGLSDPSPESEVLFLPDPKRGITTPKSKSDTKLTDEQNKPTPPRRKTLSPSRSQHDAGTDMTRASPQAVRKIKPELIDNEELHREMSYGTSDHALKKDIRKSPSMSSADSASHNLNTKAKLNLEIESVKPTISKSSPRSPNKETSALAQLLQKQVMSTKEKPSISPLHNNAPPTIVKPLQASPPRQMALTSPPLLTDLRKTSPNRKSPTPPEPIKNTPALQRSAEPVQLGVNQQVRRFSGHSLSPAKNAPALAIAIATSSLGKPDITLNEKKTSASTNGNNKHHASTITNPTIQISAPVTRSPVMERIPPRAPLATTDKLDEVHTSNEFMLVVFDKHSKVKDKDKQNSFELDLEDAIQAPPISISSPDLASLEFTNLHTFPLRRSVSSTELLYERAMARFYEAVELEEAEKVRKTKASEERTVSVQPTMVRKRLGSMTEAERLSFEKRSELRRKSTDITQELKGIPKKWGSRENITNMKRFSGAMLYNKRQDSQESEDLREVHERGDSVGKSETCDELGSDYTESTASEDENSIERFKQELLARTRTPSPRELETYHPRNMAGGVFTPYSAPSPEQAAVVLTRPVPLPSPDFVPKPILKRSSTENMVSGEISPNGSFSSNPGNTSNPGYPSGDKLDIAKGLKSFFKRDKRTPTERNTEENQIISNPTEANNAARISAELEVKRKAKEEEQRKRKEAESLMMEESHAAVDHYADLVQQVSSTRKYHTPLYLNPEELMRIAQPGSDDDDRNSLGVPEEMKLHLSSEHLDSDLAPPISNKPRLSISERGQMIHVRDTASDLAITKSHGDQVPETPSEDNAPIFPTSETFAVTEPQAERTQSRDESAGIVTTATVISETVVERLDARGRPRLVKVKHIVKRRAPSSTRSRDSSLRRPPSSLAQGESSPPDQPNSQYPVLGVVEMYNELAVLSSSRALEEQKSVEQLSDDTNEKVRSALNYSTDLVLFVFACYVYLFKDARLVLPILGLMIYRQLGEAMSAYIPNWVKRKKN